MGHFKVYKNLDEYTIVEAPSAIKAQWMAGYLPTRVVACNEDGGVSLPPGYEKVNTENKKHTK